MSYHTAGYLLVFLPAVLCIYQLVPQRFRWFVLLAASYLFYWSLCGKLLVFLISTSLFTHYICVWMKWLRGQNADCPAEERTVRFLHPGGNRDRKTLIFGIVTLLSVLGYLKYYNFFTANWNMLAGNTGFLPLIPPKELLLPAGISFYTLQAIGYMIDVYRGKAGVYLHPGKTALFLGFFPQIMEGPICAYEQTAKMLWKGKPIRSSNLSEGSVRILWGLFKKLIIADRLSILVGTVFDHHDNYQGVMIALAAIAYTVQLYMDFSGCIDIAAGSGKLFGISLPENFRQPFFAVDAADFWRRWHMSLGNWFRMYVFYPVSVSEPVKKSSRFIKARFGKKASRIWVMAMSLFPVWLCNGIWHGPKWSYIFYGMYYFVIIFLTTSLDPLRDKTLKLLHIRKELRWYKGIRILKTWIIIFIGELFFRADGFRIGMQMFRSMFRGFSLQQLMDGRMMDLGLDLADYAAVSAGCLIVLLVDIMHERGIFGKDALGKLCLPVRWAVYYGLFFSVVIFGAYGVGYQSVDAIYAGF